MLPLLSCDQKRTSWPFAASLRTLEIEVKDLRSDDAGFVALFASTLRHLAIKFQDLDLYLPRLEELQSSWFFPHLETLRFHALSEVPHHLSLLRLFRHSPLYSLDLSTPRICGFDSSSPLPAFLDDHKATLVDLIYTFDGASSPVDSALMAALSKLCRLRGLDLIIVPAWRPRRFLHRTTTPAVERLEVDESLAEVRKAIAFMVGRVEGMERTRDAVRVHEMLLLVRGIRELGLAWED